MSTYEEAQRVLSALTARYPEAYAGCWLNYGNRVHITTGQPIRLARAFRAARQALCGRKSPVNPSVGLLEVMEAPDCPACLTAARKLL